MNWILYPFWSHAERRVRALWRLVAQLAFFTFGTVVVGVVVGLILLLQVAAEETARGRSPTGEELTQMLPAAAAASWWFGPANAVGVLVVATLSLFIAGLVLDRRPFRDFGFHFGGRWWRDLAFGLALGAGLMALVFLVEMAAGWITVEGFATTIREGDIFLLGVFGALVTFVCVGIYEEMLSRGYQLRNVAEGIGCRWWTPRVALALGWVLSSAFFGLLHAGNPNATPTSTAFLMAAGLFLGLGFVLTGELAIPIGIHITWNFFQGPIFGFPVSGTTSAARLFGTRQLGPDAITGGAFGPEGGLIGLAAIALGSGLIVWWIRRTRGAAALNEDLASYSPPAS